MSVPMRIRSSESGVIRLFQIDLPKEAIERFAKPAGTGEWPLKYALGASRLRPAFVDVVAVSDLGEMTLSQYLAQAYDATGEDFRRLQPRLDALEGFVLVLPSQAFDQTEQTLSVSEPLRWIATLNEAKPETSPEPLRSHAAEGTLGRRGAGSAPAPAMLRLWGVLVALGIGAIALLIWVVMT